MTTRAFSLTEKQRVRLQAWIYKEIGISRYTAALEENCSGGDGLTYSFTPDGVVDTVVVTGFGKSVDLTLDDDGEFLT